MSANLKNNSQKTPSQGISGVTFVILSIACLTVLFTAGLLLAPDDVKLALWYNLGTLAVEYAIKLLIAVVLASAIAWVVFTQVLDTPLSELPGKCVKSHNDSHAIILFGIFISTAMLLVVTGGETLRVYTYMVLTRGSLAMFVSLFATMTLARFFGVKSMDEFRDWVNTQDNDSYSWIIVGVWVANLALALSV